MINSIEVKAGIAVDADTGMIIENMPYHMASRVIYKAHKSDRIVVNDGRVLLNVAVYGMDIPEEYIYTYMYEPEQNWSNYTHNFSEDGYSNNDFIFQEDCYFRVCLKKADGSHCTLADEERISEIVSFYSELGNEETNQFNEEIIKTTDTVYEKLAKGKSLVFALLSDSHYVVNGTWDVTIGNLSKVNEKIGFDGIIHLGDLQDGMLDKKMCRRIASKCIQDMRSICEPIYFTVGNHDTNYFKGNREWLTEEEQYGIYGRFLDCYVKREGTNGFYYVDYDSVDLRMIFLTSFDHREVYDMGSLKKKLPGLKKCLMKRLKVLKCLYSVMMHH